MNADDTRGCGTGMPALRCIAASARHESARMDDEDFLRHCEPYCRKGHSILLLSGGGGECATHSYLYHAPVAILRFDARGNVLQLGDRTHRPAGTALATMHRLLDDLHRSARMEGIPPPRIAGYLGYELKNVIEELPAKAERLSGLPDLWFMLPSRRIVHDRRSGGVTETMFTFVTDEGVALGEVEGGDSGTIPTGPLLAQRIDTSTFTRASYLEAVRRVRQHILDGDVYQINLSQRFSGAFNGDPFLYWRALYAANPAPYYSWINAGDHLVLSTSMELFARLDDRALESRPIKGTRPRGGCEIEDRAHAAELRDAAKDDAELSMIVDLIRNDMSRVRDAGSVRIRDHKRLESYTNVHHLVTIIDGTARDGCGIAAVMEAMFPGGSITGCPRIRAMEIIDDIEPVARHVYTGCIGHAAAGAAEFSIAIRTMIVQDGRFHLSLGGGIVHDSDPASEYEETLAKGRTFIPDFHGLSRSEGNGDA